VVVTGLPEISPGVSSPTSIDLQKPSEMLQDEYSGLSKTEKKRLTHVNDVAISNENRPELRLGFNQIEDKTPKHGGVHGLSLQENGKASKADALQLQQSLVDIANDPNTEWYEEGSYQSQSSVNILDVKRKLLSVYKKLPGQNYFLTEKILDSKQSVVVYNPNQISNPDAGSKVNQGLNRINEG
jgi:hypothetical protein